MRFKNESLISLGILVLLSVASFFIKLSNIPVRIWDEARNANNAVHMYLQGNWMVPYYEGSPDMWNTKPPLLIWIQTIFIRLFGINEFSIRFPAALAATLTAVVLWWFANKYFRNKWTGLFCGAVLATTLGYVQNHSGRTGDYDAPLILFITLYCCSYFYFILDENKKFLVAFWFFLTLAVLTKGIVGLMFLPGLFAFTLLKKKLLVIFRNKALWVGLAGFLFIIAGYYLLREKLNPGYLSAVYNNELGGRFLDTLEEHRHPFNYYFEMMKDNSFRYWFWWIFISFIAGLAQKSQLVKTFTLFNLMMVVPFFLVISSGGTKLEWYVFPIFPFLCLQIGWFIYYGLEKIRSIMQRGMLRNIMVVSMGAAAFFYPFLISQKQIHSFSEKPWDVEPHQPSYYLQDAIRTNKNIDGYTVIYEGYNGQINFYISALQNKGKKIILQQNTMGIQPGQLVLLNQETLKKSLLEKYKLKILEVKFGCTLYLVLSKYEQPHS
jgi:4-amino-4-deoxy-L-arabinose transferase-like glycosyltransferase